MAVLNPNFDPAKPYDEMIIWQPEGLAKLIWMDETDVRTDQTKRGRGLAASMLTLPAAVVAMARRRQAG